MLGVKCVFVLFWAFLVIFVVVWVSVFRVLGVFRFGRSFRVSRVGFEFGDFFRRRFVSSLFLAFKKKKIIRKLLFDSNVLFY